MVQDSIKRGQFHHRCTTFRNAELSWQVGGKREMVRPLLRDYCVQSINALIVQKSKIPNSFP